MSEVKLYLDDCMNIMKTIKDKSIDLILCDPPYGVNLDYSTYKDTEENWYKLMGLFIPEARRIAKMVIMPSCQIKRLGWFYKHHEPDWLISWYKGSVGCAGHLGFNDWEPLVVYGKPKKITMHDYFQSINNEAMGNFGHPCPKPVEWGKWLINRATEKGDTILDPFMGSGTTGVAAVKLDRNFIGIEISEPYFKIAQKRIAEEQAKLKLF